MKVLDLFSGLNGWGAAFSDRGHTVTTLDMDPKFGADYQLDILAVKSLDELGEFDVVVASPPCETFSVASIGHHWTGGKRAYEPKTEEAKVGMDIARHTFHLIDRWLADHPSGKYVVENPRGVMRKIVGHPTGTVWYCQYGDSRAKPTDIWTNLPLVLRGCRNGADDHDAAPRGAKTGTQGIKGYALRSLIPYQLAKEVCLACE
jgi:hypothetical protein